MRFINDEEWGSWLSQARVGKWTFDLKSFLQESQDPSIQNTTGKFIQVVSADNATRSIVNGEAINRVTTFLSQFTL